MEVGGQSLSSTQELRHVQMFPVRQSRRGVGATPTLAQSAVSICEERSIHGRDTRCQTKRREVFRD